VQAAFDPNVIISGLLSPPGAPADVLRALERGEFELVVAPALLDDLGRAVVYPKPHRRVGEAHAGAVLGSAAQQP
jgi:predicted nucleic acid-binding protein